MIVVYSLWSSLHFVLQKCWSIPGLPAYIVVWLFFDRILLFISIFLLLHVHEWCCICTTQFLDQILFVLFGDCLLHGGWWWWCLYLITCYPVQWFSNISIKHHECRIGSCRFVDFGPFLPMLMFFFLETRLLFNKTKLEHYYRDSWLMSYVSFSVYEIILFLVCFVYYMEVKISEFRCSFIGM
jgi:hypothetical protein